MNIFGFHFCQDEAQALISLFCAWRVARLVVLAIKDFYSSVCAGRRTTHSKY